MDNRSTIHEFWKALYDHDWDAVAGFFAPDGHYEDVPTPDAGATGPENVIKRLKIGLEPIERHEHQVHRMLVDGDNVVTEHTEDWYWNTGETVSLPFVSLHVLENGKIKLWRDYWDLQTLLGGAPQWWLERLAGFSADDFS
jgi:limonene-1,2-epoxide hydrolase